MYLFRKIGDSCASIETTYNIAFTEFYAWNPAIGSDCTNLWIDEAYCVSISGTTCPCAPDCGCDDGLICRCLAPNSDDPTAPCYPNCGCVNGLSAYCAAPQVLTPSSTTITTTTTITPTSTLKGLTPPGPTQTGITSACTEYYITVEGKSRVAVYTA
ncbi:MAG TPA: LysM domain-containing protein [Candidatus Saccharimonadales bacterium]